MNRFKRGIFFVATLMVSLLLVETGAQIAYRVGYGQWYRPPASSERIAAPDEPDAAAAGDESQMKLVRRARRHPYLGFIPGYDWLEAGETDLWNLPAKPPKRGSDTIIIGLFGGSLAQRMASTFNEQLTAYFAEHNPSVTPKLVTLAAGGFKQPQHLIALAYALSLGSEIDVIVTLDGFNEVYGSIRSTYRRGVSPFYPRYWDLLIEDGRSATQQALLARIAELRADIRRRKQAWHDSLAQYSAIYGLVDSYLDIRTEAEIGELHVTLAEESNADAAEARGAFPDYANEQEVSAAAVENWVASSTLMAAMASSVGAEYHHFLQPNQYVPGSKPLTDEEQATAYRESNTAAETVRLGYPLLRAAGLRLRAAGINYEDATQIFAAQSETLYADACCHLNEAGYRILSDFIIEHIATGAAFTRAPGAPGAGTPDSDQGPTEDSAQP